jgi:hypothetical protein
VTGVRGTAGRLEQQPAELLTLGPGQGAEHRILRLADPMAQLGQGLLPLRRGDDQALAPVGRIGLTLHQTGRDEVVDEVGHDRTVDPQPVGQGELTGRLTANDLDEGLVAARTVREATEHAGDQLAVRAQQDAQRPAKVVAGPIAGPAGLDLLPHDDHPTR